ncbi:MAG: enoyl-CoA hydratase-related protein [Mycobacteriales bacterium]|nr:MAG: enoyl-CoA hydratase [Pseudonocardiales bacterium]
MSTVPDQPARYDVAGAVATITMDSPANRNALSARMTARLVELLATAVRDDAVRVIVLSHTGAVFCSGMDLSESTAASADSMPVSAFPAVLRAILDAPKPTIARVAGPARAGGVGLLAACDVVVAATTSTFAFTEVRLGLVPAVISVTVLPRLHASVVRELFLTAETFDGVRAAAIGLVNSVVEPEFLDSEVIRYCHLLVRGAPGAIADTKALLAHPPVDASPEQFAALSALSARRFAGDEGQEGIASLREKRPASWIPSSARND